MSAKVMIFIIGCLLTVATSLWGATLNGLITDRQTGMPVQGALVKFNGYDATAISNESGRFSIEIPSPMILELIVSRDGYELLKAEVNSPNNKELEIFLNPRVWMGQEVIVTADRAIKGETPATFSNLSSGEIGREYWAQDAPMLLSSTPNSFAYSDAGNGIGYSYFKLRGFNQNRISVMINGIPLNGAESHEVYWVDLPDFLNNVQDIQIQRGVGTSLYGQSALGGSVNIITKDFPAEPSLEIESGYGSFNTRKLSISGNSGLIKDSYVFYGRYSKINTDGYRDNSWVDMYSYFLGIARYDRNMTWKFNTYGGPEELHLAYKGVTAEMLKTNRKFNEFSYPDEIDHFNQPHYELFHEWEINDGLKLSNSAYYFHGEGYYNQYRQDQDLAEHNLGAFWDFQNWVMYTDSDSIFPNDYYANIDSLGNPVADSSGQFQGYYALSNTTADLIRKPVVKEYDWGWIPRLTIEHQKGQFVVGGEMRIHASHHYGEVLWAEIYPNGYAPNIRYHDYKGRSNTFTIYAIESLRILDKLTLMTNIQYQRHSYSLRHDERHGVQFDRDYDFFSPRAGITYNASASISVFFNASLASRQPAFQDIYDPQDYWSNPIYRSASFIQNGDEYKYIGKELKPERLFDIELGASFASRSANFDFSSEVNLYRMQIDDELVPFAGQVDDMNLPVAGNAEQTLHQGIEIEAKCKYRNLSIGGNLSVNDDHFVNYAEYNWSGERIDLSGNRVGGFPVMTANYGIGWSKKGFDIGLTGNYIGKQYIDNNEAMKVDAHNIINSSISYDFGKMTGVESLKLAVRVMNLFDKEYEQFGYSDWSDGLPRYIVGAERNFFISLTSRL